MINRVILLRSVAVLSLLATPLLIACESNPENAVSEARNALAQGKPQQAMVHVVRALEKDPMNTETRLLAGKVSMAMGNADRAITEFTHATQDSALASEANVLLAEAYLVAGKFKLAREALEKVREDVPLAHTIKVSLAMAQGDYLEAFQLLDAALAKFPDDPRLITIDAERLWVTTETAKADQRLQNILTMEPYMPEAHMLAGRIRLSERDLDAAKAHFEKVLSVRPARQAAMLALAGIKRDQGDDQAALDWIKKSEGTGRPNPIGLFFAAQIAFDSGDIERASELIEDLPQGYSALPEFFRLRGLVAHARGQRATAIIALKKYLDSSGGDALAKRLLAENLANNNEFDAAWSVVAPLVELPETDGPTLLLALALSQKTGNGDPAAIEAIIKKRDAAPSFAEALRTSSTAISAGDWERADAILAPLAFGAAANDPIVLNNAAAVKAKLKQYSQAIALARRAHALAPKSPDILDTLGWTLWQSGTDREEARARLTQAKELAPRNAQIGNHWAAAHSEQ